MNQRQMAELRDSYATITSIDPASDTYTRLLAFLDRQPIGILRTLADARIKFVSVLAANRVNRLSATSRVVL